MTTGRRPSRRHVLASLGTGALGGLAGCSSLLWWDSPEPAQDRVALTIKTVPADDDDIAASIMSQLRENFTAAGIDTTHEPVAASELYRDVLVDGEYDVFVTRANTLTEPDTLRRLLHSTFRGEAGWQNPFNFTNVTVDDLLDAQLTATGQERDTHLVELFELLDRTAPYSVIAFPEHQTGRRRSFPATDRSAPNRPLGYLDLLSREPSDGPRDGPLRVGLTGTGYTSNLNPIATANGRVNPIFGLLYDPLVRLVDDEYVPWLAEELTWDDAGSSLSARVTLRDELTWHDGTSITADDVTFTVDFLEDTSLGEFSDAVPAPRFRGRQTAIASVSRVDSRTVDFEFESPERGVASHALTLSLLPEHIWEPRAEPDGQYETVARTTDNDDPVGSGLLAFDDRSEEAFVSLTVFDEHPFLDPHVRPDVLTGFPQFRGLTFQIAPVQGAFPDLLLDEEIDVTAAPLAPEIVERIREEPDVTIDRSPPDTMYLVGYNLHHPQLGDPRFRALLSRLIDREYVVETSLGGNGLVPETYGELFGLLMDVPTPSEMPTIPEFPGSDGEIAVDRVRSLFESEGYRYADGDLIG